MYVCPAVTSSNRKYPKGFDRAVLATPAELRRLRRTPRIGWPSAVKTRPPTVTPAAVGASCGNCQKPLLREKRPPAIPFPTAGSPMTNCDENVPPPAALPGATTVCSNWNVPPDCASFNRVPERNKQSAKTKRVALRWPCNIVPPPICGLLRPITWSRQLFIDE